MKNKTQSECPVCKGLGTLPPPRTDTLETQKTQRKHAMAKTLIDAGYSYREVADLLGWKSQSSVAHALKTKSNGKKKTENRG